MKLNINTIHPKTNISNCMTVQEIQQVTAKDKHPQKVREHILRGWPEGRNEVP